MTCSAVHSHLLCILLTTYIILVFFTLSSNEHLFKRLEQNTSMFEGNIGKFGGTEITTGEIQGADVEIIRVLCGVVLHVVCIFCVFACIIMNNVNKCRKTTPPIVIFVILIFNCLFNIGGALALWSYKNFVPYTCSSNLRGSAYVASVALLLAMTVGAVFFFKPPVEERRNELEVEKGRFPWLLSQPKIAQQQPIDQFKPEKNSNEKSEGHKKSLKKNSPEVKDGIEDGSKERNRDYKYHKSVSVKKSTKNKSISSKKEPEEKKLRCEHNSRISEKYEHCPTQSDRKSENKIGGNERKDTGDAMTSVRLV